MKLKLNIIIIIIFLSIIGYYANAQNVTGSVLGTNFNYIMNNDSLHSFSFTTYFSMGGGNCPPFSSTISFSDDTMFVKATYDICGFWPALGCVRNDVIDYTQIIPSNIQYIIMSTDVITCETGEPTLVENVYTRTYDRNLGITEVLKNNISIYPNPANDVLNITSNGVFNAYIVYDLLGKKLIESNQNIISVESLSQGVYLLEAKQGNEKVLQMFVKN